MKAKLTDIFQLFLIVMTVMTMNDNAPLAAELAPHLYKTTLDNGLTVIVKETPGTKVATVQIWVRAGSVYEEPREAGITHLIEHMIFKGTPTRGPGKLAEAVEGVGGQINAYTSHENTVYHATLSARHWGLALEVLADAVQNSVFDPEELEREKKVVLEEIGMRNDRPNVRLFEELMANAYAVHPYRRPVIGDTASVSALSRDDILAYMRQHYYPQNLCVVVVGDVAVAEVVEEVHDRFIGLPAQEPTRPVRVEEPVQSGPRLFTVKADITQPQMALALPISRFASPETPVLDVIAQIVGQGETSRLYRSLRNDKQLVFGINGSAFTPQDPGLFEITAVLDNDKMLPALEATLVELFRLKHVAVSSAELERAKHSLESDFVFNLERVEGQARTLGSFEFLTGDPQEDEYLAKIRAVTVDDVKRVAAMYFAGERLTAGFLVPLSSTFALEEEKLAEIIATAEAKARMSDTEALVASSYLSDVYRYRLPNGITLLVREEQTVPTVAIRAVFPGGQRAETPLSNGAFALISELLPKGTAKMSAQGIATAVADMAGSLSGFTGKNTFGLKAEFLARFFAPALELTRDMLREPAFAEGEADKIRPELLARLKQQEDSLPGLVFREFNAQLFDGHPYGLNPIGVEAIIRSYTTAALRTHYERYARPDRLVLTVAGAVKADEVREQVIRLFGDWTAPRSGAGATTITESLLPPDPPPQPKIVAIPRDKEQVHLIIGFVGTSLASPDRYSLEVLDTLLSGQSGRLFSELRDRQSLAYSLSSFSLLGVDTGSFGIYIGTSPDKKEAALAGIWRELERVREEPVSEAELARAKSILIGHYELGLQTHDAQALEIALNETYKLGQDFGSRYVEAINAVDSQAVLAAARKFILPDHYVMVSVGALGAAADQAPNP